MLNSLLANGADGISDIEGKAVTGSGAQAGTRASFNGFSFFPTALSFMEIVSKETW